MAYMGNPFLERMSERTTSDQEFVRQFAPSILDNLDSSVFDRGVYIFRSAPGGGKTTLLRAFTPSALRAFWNARTVPSLADASHKFNQVGVLDPDSGPLLVGIMLSCASGYADLPPGPEFNEDGVFRALLDCRVVLRALRSIATLAGESSSGGLAQIAITYSTGADDLKSIPLIERGDDLAKWAEEREKTVYAHLDSMLGSGTHDLPAHHRFESLLWLQETKFFIRGQPVAPRRLVMIDDLHKLRGSQRRLLVDELTNMRPAVSVWLAARTSELGDELLSPGVRSGRDVREYVLEDFWMGRRGFYQFGVFARNVLDRRMSMQSVVASLSLSQCLRAELRTHEISETCAAAFEFFERHITPHYRHARYKNWLHAARHAGQKHSIESLFRLYTIRILMARDASKRQLTLDLELSQEELESRDSSQVRSAAEIFAHDEVGIPHYYGFERLCQMASSNIEELLGLAASLYDGLRSKHSLRNAEVVLSPAEQEEILTKAAQAKRDFIPRHHQDGLRCQRLVDAIGSYCRDRTFLPTAPYAPGVTGVRLSDRQLDQLMGASRQRDPRLARLKSLLAECVAENLLAERPSAASDSRDSGTIFYLNRTLCCHYGLPLQLGGWQDVSLNDLMDWMESGRRPQRTQTVDLH